MYVKLTTEEREKYRAHLRARLTILNQLRADDPLWREQNRQARLAWYRNPENKARMAPISRLNGRNGGRPLGRKDSHPRKVVKQASMEARNP